MTTAAALAAFIAIASPVQDAPHLFDELGGLHMKVSTNNELSQRYFDQGLAFFYGFNLDESLKAFEHAAKLDPDCAMNWWGVALSNGPHINFTEVPPDKATAAWEALERAKTARASQKERNMITAARARFSSDSEAARAPLDLAYRDAMKKLASEYPADADIVSLYAESEMILHPWDLHFSGGKPKPWTEEMIKIVQGAVELDSKHPLALHLYIHAVEGSYTPELAEEAADDLLRLQPDLGHMVHMPSHIYVRVGRWNDGIESNRMAIEAEREYVAKSPQQGNYVFYMSHNHAMLSYAAMMSGRRADAESSWAESMDYFPKDVMKQYAAFVDGIGGAEFEVKVRFGLWDEILEMPEPDEAFPLDRTIRHMARAISWAVKGDAKRARMEQSLFYDAKDKVPAGEWGMPFSTTDKVIAVAEHLMNGEILLGEGDLDKSIQTLKKAAAAEDQLTYTEPPDWLMPPRHALGAVMIKAGRFEEAESVYREDLRRVRNNGWALYGLSQALRGQGKTGEADSNDAVFAEVWKHADTEIDSSCKCVEFQ